MKQTRSLMGMHITIEVVDRHVTREDIDALYVYSTSIDMTFSPYKKASEVSKINDDLLTPNQYSDAMQTVLRLSEETKKETYGYFDVYHKGKLDPSGLVKGWAIWQAAQMLEKNGFNNFYVDAGGDIQTSGKNIQGTPWSVGIRNPFNSKEIVKVLILSGSGIATSGISERGQHIYNPHAENTEITDIVSMTVIGPNVYEADRFATAAFAMGKKGIHYIQQQPHVEGYMIDTQGIATYTRGFTRYVGDMRQDANSLII